MYFLKISAFIDMHKAAVWVSELFLNGTSAQKGYLVP